MQIGRRYRQADGDFFEFGALGDLDLGDHGAVGFVGANLDGGAGRGVGADLD